MRHILTLLLGMIALVWLVPGRANDTVYYYYTNTLHSAVVETNAQGTVVETTYYAPYGQVLNRSMRDGPGYTGHEEDPETGLNYMQQRYYDPQSGRFLSTDPVATSGSGGNFNRYWYASDNPYTYTDPNGEQDCVPTAKGSKGGTKCGPPTTGCLTQGCSASANTSVIIVDDGYRRGSDAQQMLTRIVASDHVGNSTVGGLSKILTNEIGSLSTPNHGDPDKLRNGAIAIANALIDNANRVRPNLTAPDTGTASQRLANIMQEAYLNRSFGIPDPVDGRTFYGTSHIPPSRLLSRPIGRGRQTVYASFGPFNDSTSTEQTYIYIYNDPGR